MENACGPAISGSFSPPLFVVLSNLYQLIIMFIVLLLSKTLFAIVIDPGIYCYCCGKFVTNVNCSIIVQPSVSYCAVILIVIQFLGSRKYDNHATNTMNATQESQECTPIVIQ